MSAASVARSNLSMVDEQHQQQQQQQQQKTVPTTEQQPLVIVIAGPTASGKSDVAAKICADRRGMIVSADSVQAYRGVQIGANKPTMEERTETPHILIDVADHEEQYNAAEWREDAIFCVQTMLQQQNNTSSNGEEEGTMAPSQTLRRRQGILENIQQSCNNQGYTSGDDDNNGSAVSPILPVVCGGTMMYLQWLVHGRPDAFQPTVSAVKESYKVIEKFQSNTNLADSNQNFQDAVTYVSSFGKVFADRIKQFCGEDWYRLRRTLEIALTVEEQSNALSDDDDNDDDSNGTFRSSSRESRRNQLVENLYSGQRLGGLESLGYDTRCFFLCPDDRMSHTRVIDERCEQMIVKGLIQETTDLKLSGCLPDMAERAIGYRQTLDYLHQELGPSETEEEIFERYIDTFTTATRRYAKKQMSWFRKDKNFIFVAVPLQKSKQDRAAAVAQQIEEYIQVPRKNFESTFLDEGSLSSKCRRENESQGKSMKFYQPQRFILKAGSKLYKDAFSEAVKCRQRIRLSKTKKRNFKESLGQGQ